MIGDRDALATLVQRTPRQLSHCSGFDDAVGQLASAEGTGVLTDLQVHRAGNCLARELPKLRGEAPGLTDGHRSLEDRVRLRPSRDRLMRARSFGSCIASVSMPLETATCHTLAAWASLNHRCLMRLFRSRYAIASSAASSTSHKTPNKYISLLPHRPARAAHTTTVDIIIPTDE